MHATGFYTRIDRSLVSHTYARRKTRHCCSHCQAPAAPNRVSCAACLAKMRQTSAHYRRDHPAPTPFAAVAGPALACCGTWEPITQVPHTCPHCQRVYFTSADMAHMARGG